MAGETIVLGKNVAYTGISHVIEASITTTFTEIDKTKAGDTKRTILLGWAEQTLEATCIDAPGVSVGSSVVVTATGANGHNLSSIKFLVTSIGRSEPIDDKTTFTVSCTRGVQ